MAAPPSTTRSHRALLREAATMAADLGLNLSRARVALLVRCYLRSGQHVSLRTWFLTYADPTGEQAVRNVMAARG